MKFSYSSVWDDTVRMVRSDASLLLAIAGVFFLLPAALVAHFIPQPEGAETLAEMVRQVEDYMGENWHWMLLAQIANMTGAIAMFLLLLGDGRRTVGEAIVGALPILPFYFVASLLSSIIVGIGFVLFIIPALYLFGRLAVLGPIVVVEERNPFRAIGRSFQVTKSKGWAVFGLVFLVAVAGAIVTYAATFILGSIFLLALGERIGGLLVLLLGALASAVLSTVLVALYAAIYRALSEARSGADQR